MASIWLRLLLTCTSILPEREPNQVQLDLLPICISSNVSFCFVSTRVKGPLLPVTLKISGLDKSASSAKLQVQEPLSFDYCQRRPLSVCVAALEAERPLASGGYCGRNDISVAPIRFSLADGPFGRT